MLAILLFLIGLVMLIKGGDWFVDGAIGIANKFNMPKLLVGATIVSIGTTLPEVMVSSLSAASGHSQIAYGNSIGSIICNTALISAITLLFVSSNVKRKNLVIPSAFFFVSGLVYISVSYSSGKFSRCIGIVLLSIFLIYMIVAVKSALNDEKNNIGDNNSDKKDVNDNFINNEDVDATSKNLFLKNISLLIFGGIIIAVGSKLLIDNGTIIARNVGVPESVIGITMIALGTSLPELITAITSLKKHESNLSIGNIIGANLFNLCLVSGMAITIKPFSIPNEKIIFGTNASLLVEIPVMVVVMIILVVPTLIKKKTYKMQGAILLLVYILFLIEQFFV